MRAFRHDKIKSKFMKMYSNKTYKEYQHWSPEKKRLMTQKFFTEDCYKVPLVHYRANEAIYFKLVHSNIDNKNCDKSKNKNPGAISSKSLKDFKIAPNPFTALMDDVFGSKPKH